MATNKITVGGTAETPTYTKTDLSITDKLVAAAVSPFSAFDSEDTEFYPKSVMGLSSILWGVGGFMLGDKFGANVPVIGGRR